MKKLSMMMALSIVACTGGETMALTKRMNVERDKPADAGGFYTIRRDCHAKPAQVEILDAPKHGSLSFQERDWTISHGPGVIDRCIGRITRATVGTYTPNKGFVGSDSYRLRAAYPQSSGESAVREWDVDVTIREPAAKKNPTDGGWIAPR
jgi:hypothetical protein